MAARSGDVKARSPNILALHVAILLGTKDGSQFSREQLSSYETQSHANWSLHVSDDRSADATMALVKEFSNRVDQIVTIRHGPDRGPARNFISLAQDGKISADYFAFSDQDDVWFPDKLERALVKLQGLSEDLPALYCSRTETVDECMKHLGFSKLFTKPPSFQNALVQSIAGANTMVFNNAARRLIQAAGDAKILHHDWWLYQIVSAAGGIVYYDRYPSLAYRQHGANVQGSNRGIRPQLSRIRRVRVEL